MAATLCAAPSIARAEPPRRLWIGVSGQADWAVASGEDVCSPASQIGEDFACFRASGTQYLGTPKAGQGGSVSGPALGTTRLLAHVDYLFTPSIAVGARGGAAFGGGPKSSGAETPSFFPLHLAVRATLFGDLDGLHFLPGLSWELFVGSGAAQFDTGYTVDVVEDPKKRPPLYQLDNPPQQTLTAYRRVGKGFVEGGGGLVYRVDPVAVALELGAAYGFPSAGLVVSPALSVSIGL